MNYQLCEEALIAARNLAVWAGIMRVETANLIFTYEQIASAAFLHQFEMLDTRGVSLSTSDGLCIWYDQDASRYGNPNFVRSKSSFSWPDYHQGSSLDFRLSNHENELLVALTVSYSYEGKRLSELTNGPGFKPSLGLTVCLDQVVTMLGIKQDIIALGKSGHGHANQISVHF